MDDLVVIMTVTISLLSICIIVVATSYYQLQRDKLFTGILQDNLREQARLYQIIVDDLERDIEQLQRNQQ